MELQQEWGSADFRAIIFITGRQHPDDCARHEGGRGRVLSKLRDEDC